MRIGRIIDSIPFTKDLKIPVKDKSTIRQDGNRFTCDTDYNKILAIAGKNKLGVTVAEDVFIFEANEQVEEDLKNAGLSFIVLDPAKGE